MNWIEELIDQHKEYEAPLTFWYWSGLATISAVIKDNIFIDRAGLYNLYPNIYVMLHAVSGLRKGPPVNLAKRLVGKVNNTRVITGRSSIQGILKKLATAYTLPGGIVVNKATAFICSSELTSSIVEDKAATDILTDLYDRNYNAGNWERLLASDSQMLKDATVTMLTATNEAHSEDFFARKEIQGGYIARTFVIYADKRNKINSLIDPVQNPPNDDSLAKYLRELSQLKGPFKPLTKTDVGEFYKEWYTKFINDTDQLVDDTGTINRFGDSVLKVALLLSLARAPILEIRMDAMEEAIFQCEKLIGHTRRVTMGRRGKSSFANQKVMIVEKLLARDNHAITRAQLMMDMHYHLNSNELDEIMKGFDESGLIKVENRGNVMMYVMPDYQVDKLKSWLEGKK